MYIGSMTRTQPGGSFEDHKLRALSPKIRVPGKHAGDRQTPGISSTLEDILLSVVMAVSGAAPTHQSPYASIFSVRHCPYICMAHKSFAFIRA